MSYNNHSMIQNIPIQWTPPTYEYMSSQPPAYSSSDAAGLNTSNSEFSKDLIKINEHIESKYEGYYSTWRGVLAGISTFTILEIFGNFFF